MELMNDLVRYRVNSGVAEVRMMAAESGNALTVDLLDGLKSAVRCAIADESCRVIVLSAEGRHFCQGMNLSSFCDGGVPSAEHFRSFAEFLKLVYRSSRPVIALVDGDAVGGGVGIVAACDVVLATSKSAFILPEVILGMVPVVIVPFLRRRVSLARVRYMALSSRAIGAPDARLIGLVDELVEDQVEDLLDIHIQRLLRSSPLALAGAKRYLEGSDPGELDREVDGATEWIRCWLERPEVVEGIQVFADGFAPSWFETWRRPKSV
jgi:methylglutaconyl-CoA hydratase/polyketide biosynthesis enoyl-CoA hydratase PksH